jgi:hypothetical protein
MKSDVKELIELAIWVFGIGGTMVGALKTWYSTKKIKPLQAKIDALEKELEKEKDDRIDDVKELYKIITRK